MRILAANCGSSTLKFKLIEVDGEGSSPNRGSVVAVGSVERIGSGQPAVDFSSEKGECLQQSIDIEDHDAAIRCVFDWLTSTHLVGPDGPEAVGHRIVHGGDSFSEPALIEAIESLVELAPLHNGPSLAAIRAAREVLNSSVPMVAVFDTAFHSSLPEHAAQYAIPKDLADRHGIRRYGFHGIAHRYMTERYAAITGTSAERVKLVTLQLGNGCSATAVRDGLSVDTSMGFTPLEGLMMGTRSGNIDPFLVGFFSRQENVDVAEVERWLNTRSGL